ncbi:pyrroline-5-carboxylate reductase [Paenibacillus alvei]|uniref:Pyrroline-5-carboxylate reductase n=1 Tax=Paenibacillus alvei TaxID=44250 RepID=A0ABT4GSL1_PAEAL|nr:pyrroline-5-carboxylate reductase [Paenibacillus alvei]MCY9759682.1 pyrroline-5-carboxylate reductase [Paenibacillus alvei]MCY9767893.1 pyrroline-5-carboxylate reductase [Paenibacillus alvei]
MDIMNETITQEKDTFRSLRICIFGAGSIAEAIVRGVLAKQLTEPEQFSMINRSNNERLQELKRKYGVTIELTSKGKQELLHEADVIVLCMKPKDAAAALHELKPLLRPGTLIISVIAGLSLHAIQHILGPIAAVRTMPNTSSTIGLGATAICCSQSVDDTQRAIAMIIFEAIGIAVEVEEQHMNIVTGLSGSGPAYLYYVMEAMMQAGVEGGLTQEIAHDLTVQTVLGAAEMVRRMQEEPAELRRKVTSPGGTTQAALDVMNSHYMSKTIISAVHRAAERSQEMEHQIGREIE